MLSPLQALPRKEIYHSKKFLSNGGHGRDRTCELPACKAGTLATELHARIF